MDLTTIASHIHSGLMSASCADAPIANEDLCGGIAYHLKLFNTAISHFDAEVNSELSFNLEKSSLKMPTCMSVFRDWAKSIGLFGGQGMTTWLRQISASLQAEAHACLSKLPSWSACFEQGRLLESVAAKVLDKKLESIVGAHNQLHKKMSLMSSAASLLEVSPRLRDHPETIEAAHISFDVMGKASDSSIVALAVELILRFQLDSSGISGARQFLSKYKKVDHPSPPEVLWAEVGSIAAHGERGNNNTEKCGSPASKATGAASTAASPTVASPKRATRASSPTPTNPSEVNSDSMVKRTPGSSAKQRPPGPPSLCFSSSKKPRPAA